MPWCGRNTVRQQVNTSIISAAIIPIFEKYIYLFLKLNNTSGYHIKDTLPHAGYPGRHQRGYLGYRHVLLLVILAKLHIFTGGYLLNQSR